MVSKDLCILSVLMKVFFSTDLCFKIWLCISVASSFDHWIPWPLNEWLIPRLWNILWVFSFCQHEEEPSDREESIFFFPNLTSSLFLEDISTSLKVNAFCYWFCRRWSKFAHTKLEFVLVVYFFNIFGSDFVHLVYHLLIIIVIYIGRYLWILWSNSALKAGSTWSKLFRDLSSHILLSQRVMCPQHLWATCSHIRPLLW